MQALRYLMSQMAILPQPSFLRTSGRSQSGPLMATTLSSSAASGMQELSCNIKQ